MTQVPLVERRGLIDKRTDEQRFVFFNTGAGQEDELKRQERCANQQDLISEAGNQADFASPQSNISVLASH